MISAIILTKDSESLIEGAIQSLSGFATEIIVVDTGSSDRTIQIAKDLGAKVIEISGGNYSDWRNRAINEAKGEWIFYLDSDETLTPESKTEMENAMQSFRYPVFAIPRINMIFNKKMIHGGEWPDYQIRLFNKVSQFNWEGDLHERPVFQGELGHLVNPMLHLKHNSISDMIEKTNKWSEVEAKLLYESGHPQMSWWRFIRIMLTEIFSRLIIKKGFLDGPEGVIYSFYQMWSKFLTYAKLLQMQSLPKINHEIYK